MSVPHAVRRSADTSVSAGVGHSFAAIRVQRKKKKKKAKATKLTEAQVRAHIASNNKSTVSTDLLTCLIWKESGFDPKDKNSSSSATGLMQMTKGAVTQVNKSSPKGVHFTHAQMTDPAKNIDCGSRYLQIRIDWAGSTKAGLNGFGTGSGYADNILDCEKCFTGKPANPTSCLTAIHP
jgi:soluble lytic murein transglycosylase-like protein